MEVQVLSCAPTKKIPKGIFVLLLKFVREIINIMFPSSRGRKAAGIYLFIFFLTLLFAWLPDSQASDSSFSYIFSLMVTMPWTMILALVFLIFGLSGPSTMDAVVLISIGAVLNSLIIYWLAKN